jgi:hypothetical protein
LYWMPVMKLARRYSMRSSVRQWHDMRLIDRVDS